MWVKSIILATANTASATSSSQHSYKYPLCSNQLKRTNREYIFSWGDLVWTIKHSLNLHLIMMVSANFTLTLYVCLLSLSSCRWCPRPDACSGIGILLTFLWIIVNIYILLQIENNANLKIQSWILFTKTFHVKSNKGLSTFGGTFINWLQLA